MTHLEFASKMQQLRQTAAEDRDVENNHSKADALLCEALRELGYGDGIDIYEDPTWTRWYA